MTAKQSDKGICVTLMTQLSRKWEPLGMGKVSIGRAVHLRKLFPEEKKGKMAKRGIENIVSKYTYMCSCLLMKMSVTES